MVFGGGGGAPPTPGNFARSPQLPWPVDIPLEYPPPNPPPPPWVESAPCRCRNLFRAVDGFSGPGPPGGRGTEDRLRGVPAGAHGGGVAGRPPWGRRAARSAPLLPPPLRARCLGPKPAHSLRVLRSSAAFQPTDWERIGVTHRSGVGVRRCSRIRSELFPKVGPHCRPGSGSGCNLNFFKNFKPQTPLFP